MMGTPARKEAFMELSLAVRKAVLFLGERYFAPLHLSYSRIEDPNRLFIEKQGCEVRIEYGRLSSLFFGLSLVKLNRKKENYRFDTIRRFSMDGYMHDCSRNGVVNIEEAKRTILISALFGMDSYMLYTEDTYEIPGEPYFGYLRGRLSKDEIREIVSYASSFGIEVIPCIQTLSHLNQALRWSVYGGVAETKQTLKVGEEETYRFIEKMIRACREAFETHRIHIGMDEAWDLGTGFLMHENRAIDRKAEFLKHLAKVEGICRKYDFVPMMWEDMFFRLHPESKLSWYENAPYLTEDIKALIPEVDLIYWDYYNDDPKVYDSMFKASLSTGRNVLFADGCFRWIGFAPSVTASMRCTRAGLESAIRNGVKETFITSWGDCGNECSVHAVYHTFALHSCYDFFENGDDKLVSDVLKTILGYDLETWRLLESPNHLRKELCLAESPSKYFFYQDILMGLYDAHVQPDYALKYAQKAQELRKASKRKGAFPYVFRVLSLLCDFLSVKVDIGCRIRKAYADGDKDALRSLQKDLTVCREKLRRFVNAFRDQWEKENKIFGYEVLEGRFGFLFQRIETAKRRIEEYLTGKIPSIPELEETILPYDNRPLDDGIHNPFFGEISTTNVVS